MKANFEILSDTTTLAETRLAAAKAKLVAESAIAGDSWTSYGYSPDGARKASVVP